MIDRDELMAMCGRDAPDPEPDTWAEEEASAREICGEISLEGSRFCVLDVGHSGPHAVWSDRIITAWYDAAQLIDSVYNGDAFFAGATQESFMKFAKAVALAINFKYKVTGARVTRYTTAASQYPVYVLEVTNGGKGLRDTTRQSRMRCYRDGFTDGYYFASESDETDGTMD